MDCEMGTPSERECVEYSGVWCDMESDREAASASTTSAAMAQNRATGGITNTTAASEESTSGQNKPKLTGLYVFVALLLTSIGGAGLYFAAARYNQAAQPNGGGGGVRNLAIGNPAFAFEDYAHSLAAPQPVEALPPLVEHTSAGADSATAAMAATTNPLKAAAAAANPFSPAAAPTTPVAPAAAEQVGADLSFPRVRLDSTQC